MLLCPTLGDNACAAFDHVGKNSIGMEFLKIPAGMFLMGAGHDNADADESPAHPVTISQSFYLGRCEVTQAQWKQIMGNNPSQYQGDDNPVENVSWNEVQEFIRRLNEKESTDSYRLPTEAEWEYAARAGIGANFFFGEEASDIIFYAWYNFNSGGSSHQVGMKKTNAFGLHDIYGNVSEWVQDMYDERYYAQSPAIDPSGPVYGARRVARGCSWNNGVTLCRSAQRFAFEPDERQGFVGFRLLREMK